MTTTRRRTPRARLTGALCALLAAGALLVACSASADQTASADGGAPAAKGADAAAADEDAGGRTGSSDDRLVVQTGSVYVEAEDPIAVAQRLTATVTRLGGRVESRSESAATTDTTASAFVTVRVPADEVSAVVEELRGLGDVTQVDLRAEDVTGTAQDLDARVHALEISVERMETLMTSAGTTADLLRAEEALAERQAELERLQSERARLADQVALSTIEVVVSGPGSLPTTTEDETFVSGLERGWEALVTTFGVLLVVLGVLLPWLAMAGLVALVVVLARRRRRAPAAPPVEPDRAEATPVGAAPSSEA